MLSRLNRATSSLRPAKSSKRAKLNRPAAEILAEVAHEMRQPLTAAIAAFRILRDSLPGAKDEHACVILERQFRRLSCLIEDLSESSRSHLHVRHLRTEQLDLRGIVEDAAESVRAAIDVKRQRLHVELPSGPIWIDADWARLQQVLSNLLLNGIKFTPADGVVSIVVSEQLGMATVKISDTGRGIPSHLLAKLFEPFVTGDTGPSGLGLGLAVAREFVELHGGTIRAMSDGVGRGSAFVVSLPTISVRNSTDAVGGQRG